MKYKIKTDSEYYGKFVDPLIIRDNSGNFFLKITANHRMHLPDHAVEEDPTPFRIADEVKESEVGHLGMVVHCTHAQVDILWDGEDVVQCCLISNSGITKTGKNRAQS